VAQDLPFDAFFGATQAHAPSSQHSFGSEKPSPQTGTFEQSP
jgi:hypothetical protein